MIDIRDEQLVAIAGVPELLPRRRSGRAIHLSTVYRWVQKGVRGVFLEVVHVGGSTYTSMEALQRFTDRLSLSDSGTSAPKLPTTRTKARQAERAAQKVGEILGGR